MAKRSKKKQAEGAGVSTQAASDRLETAAATNPATSLRSGAARRRQAQQNEPVTFTWPFGQRNLIMLGLALFVIVIGYVFLGMGPYDGAASLTIGPLLLVLGYMVLLPVGILVRDKKTVEE